MCISLAQEYQATHEIPCRVLSSHFSRRLSDPGACASNCLHVLRSWSWESAVLAQVLFLYRLYNKIVYKSSWDLLGTEKRSLALEKEVAWGVGITEVNLDAFLLPTTSSLLYSPGPGSMPFFYMSRFTTKALKDFNLTLSPRSVGCQWVFGALFAKRSR